MKRIILAVAVTGILCGPAFAQDAAQPATTEAAAPVSAAAVPAQESVTTVQEPPVPQPVAPEPPAEPELDAEARTKARLKGKILEVIETAIDSADVELTDEAQQELDAELAALEEEVEGEHGRGIHVAVSPDIDGAVPLGGILLGGLAILLIFGTPIMIVAFVLYAGYRKRRQMHDTITQFLASGKEVPPEVLKHLQGQVAPKNYMQKGVMWTAVGLGILSFFMILGEEGAAALGCIPLFIGLAQLLIWKLEQHGNAAKE